MYNGYIHLRGEMVAYVSELEVVRLQEELLELEIFDQVEGHRFGERAERCLEHIPMKQESEHGHGQRMFPADVGRPVLEQVPVGAPLQHIGGRDHVCVQAAEEEVVAIVAIAAFRSLVLLRASTTPMMLQVVVIALQIVLKDVGERNDHVGHDEREQDAVVELEIIADAIAACAVRLATVVECRCCCC